LLLLVAPPAHADPVARLTKVFTETVESPTRTVTFFRGLAGLENLDVRGDALAGALADSKIDNAEGMLGAFVSGMRRLVKRGEYVTIYRDSAVTLKTPNGAVLIPKRARIRVRSAGAGKVTLDKMDGARAGNSAEKLYPLRWLELSVDTGGITTARLNAGYGFGFNRTVTLVLKRPKPKAKPAGGLAANVPE
jgi:hypothetical protein